MRKEWFEPGPDGVSPFEREYWNCPMGMATSISAAFRALLAEDEAIEPPALQVGDVVRLRAELARLKNECSDQQSYVLDLESAIARKDTRIKVLEVANDSLTQYSSNLTTERDALQASLRDEQAKRASIEAELAACRESRDALRARIDAGRVMYGGMYGREHDLEMWTFNHVDTDMMTALLIDARPIDQPDAAMVDERKGKADRREIGCDASYEARIAVGREHTRKYINQNDCNGTVNCARSNDRRRTAGTRADRKGC